VAEVEKLQQLVECAIEARRKAYVPYSKFPVGAALLGKSGTIYQGCNVENASYGLCNCAERTAIFKAVSEGETEFAALAVVGDTVEPIAPCGACRQVIAEFNIPTIIMANLKGDSRQVSLNELLPFFFSPADLEGVK
jgi:cytidine deaminase